MFNRESYERHKDWYNQQFPTDQSKIDFLRKRNDNPIKNNVDAWLQNMFFSSLDPLLKKSGQSWLTIGDAYGFDAQYILERENLVVATDLNNDFLSLAKDEGIIFDFSLQNAEHLSYPDCEFDYILCKESYHHFPRPYAALYEMIRVAKKGIVVMEPQDPISRMPLLLFLVNMLKAGLVHKIWKNRFSFEPVGNFVYKISEREFEKFAAGLNLPLVAFKKINPNYHFRGADETPVSLKNTKFRRLYFKKKITDLLVKIRAIPSQVLSVIVFKEIPDQDLMTILKATGYRLVFIPENPYLKRTKKAPVVPGALEENHHVSMM